jgi:flagellin-specific chaperone FliS
VIRINESWAIKTEENCTMLMRARIVTGDRAGQVVKPENIGKAREQVVGYYANIVQALEAFLEKASRSEVDEANGTIADLKAAWDLHMQEIRDVR